MSTPPASRTVQLAPEVEADLAERARELGSGLTPLAERYVTEGLRMDRHPGIVFREAAGGRRAALAGHRLDVWQIIETVRDSGGDVTEAADYLGLSSTQMQAAIGYYAEFRREIDDWIARNTAAAEAAESAWRRQQVAHN